MPSDVAQTLSRLPNLPDDSVFPENPEVPLKELDKYFIHDFLLSNNIPLIKGLASSSALLVTRLVFFGVSPAMGGCDSFPIRAMAVV